MGQWEAWGGRGEPHVVILPGWGCAGLSILSPEHHPHFLPVTSPLLPQKAKTLFRILQ